MCVLSFGYVYTVEGLLYLGGKNSHVIGQTEDMGRRQKTFLPKLVNSSGMTIRTVRCGSWHIAAITGKPGKSSLLLLL